MAPGAEMAARPPRIPKLTYRNRVLDQSSTTSQTSPVPSIHSAIDADHPPLTPSSTASTTGPVRLSSDTRSIKTSSSASTSLASSDGSTTKGSKSSSTTKKKKTGVLNFLTLKEPSQIALEQFAESQRKQAAAKSGTAANVVGLQGASPQKQLPPNVPKVNSRWDGIPGSTKSSRTSTSSKRTSTSSSVLRPTPSSNYSYNASALSVTSDGSRGPPNSLASPMASTFSVNQRRHSGVPQTQPFSSPSTSSLPEMTCFFPDNPDLTGSLPTSPAEPWSPPPPPPDLALQAFSFNDTDSVASNAAASDTSSVDGQADAIFRKLQANGAFLAGEAQEVQVDDENEDADLGSGSHDFLFVQPPPPIERDARPPPLQLAPNTDISPSHSRVSPIMDRNSDLGTRSPTTTNFSRPRPSPFATQKPMTLPLPTLYEASIASSDTVMDLTEMKRTETKDSDSSSIAPSIAASVTSVTPSEMSGSWYRSPRERLGLGGRLRKNDVLPWEDPEQEPPAEVISAPCDAHVK